MALKASKKLRVWVQWLLLGVALLAGSALADFFDTTSQSMPSEFNHMASLFPLTGRHGSEACGTCHLGGLFKGTVRQCDGCHRIGARVPATPKPLNHVVTTEACDICHNTITFAGAKFNHAKVGFAPCVSCHNGRITQGKPVNHQIGLQATEACGRCHRTFGWLPVRFDHTAVAAGSCASQCHNGLLATGRPSGHTTRLKAVSSCDACHRFFAWYPTFYNHNGVAPGSCATQCHNGVDATGRPAGHSGLKATLVCDRCHQTYAWIPARFDHVGVIPGSCGSACHNGSLATGKPVSHTGAKATLNCDSCHNNTSVWLPAYYNHAGIAPGSCSSCHLAQRPASHAARGYNASCDACHLIGPVWVFNHAMQQGKHTCNACHSGHNNQTPCDYCHNVNSWH